MEFLLLLCDPFVKKMVISPRVPDKVRNHLLPSSLHERIKAGDGQKQVKDGQLRVIGRISDRLGRKRLALTLGNRSCRDSLAYRPNRRSALSLCRPRCLVAEAMFVAPAIRSRLMARLRSEAII